MLINPKIEQVVHRLIRTYQTRDPEKLAKRLKVDIIPFDDPISLAGLYTVILDRSIILIHPELNQIDRSIVLAHELGHHILHKQQLNTVGYFSDHLSHWCAAQSEVEANLFAAHFMLDEQSILNAYEDGYTDEDIAQMMNVTLDLLYVKLQAMSKKYPTLHPLRHPTSDMLKDLLTYHASAS